MDATTRLGKNATFSASIQCTFTTWQPIWTPLCSADAAAASLLCSRHHNHRCSLRALIYSGLRQEEVCYHHSPNFLSVEVLAYAAGSDEFRAKKLSYWGTDSVFNTHKQCHSLTGTNHRPPCSGGFWYGFLVQTQFQEKSFFSSCFLLFFCTQHDTEM